jgi:hypothetical protein
MTTPEDGTERDGQLRRTRSVRRGVVAAGATGALGAAIAIGASIHTSAATDSGATNDGQSPAGQDRSFSTQDNQGLEQPPQAGRLAGPGGGGPAQGRSGGS